MRPDLVLNLFQAFQKQWIKYTTLSVHDHMHGLLMWKCFLVYTGACLLYTSNPNSELVQSAVNVPNLVQVPDALISQAREFQQAMMMYTCAIREVKTKLEVLNLSLIHIW